MTEKQSRARTGETVRVYKAQHKKLKAKSNDLYQEKDRNVPIAEIIEWLIDNHLDDFPM